MADGARAHLSPRCFFMSDEPIFEEEPGEELARMAQEAIESQTGSTEVGETRLRCERVLQMHKQGLIYEARDSFHAALVLLYGERTSHYQMARVLARQSAMLEESRAWSLEAMAWDRWLLSMGRPQRFGTQIIKHGGRWSLNAVDPRVTDNERAMYGVPPLFVQEQRAQQLQREEDRDD